MSQNVDALSSVRYTHRSTLAFSPFSQLGTDDELGASAWATMVNKAGGVLGHKVALVQENDASNPATAAALVHKCVSQEHANFIFGPEETSTASAAVPAANQLQTVLVGWRSGWNGQGISDANLHSYSFPGIGNVFFADDLATVTQLIVPRHYTRVAVIEHDPDMLTSISEHMWAMVEGRLAYSGDVEAFRATPVYADLRGIDQA